jgi:hypothetical protein
MVNSLFDIDDLRVQLADRMDISPEGFNPLYSTSDDYKVLQWMRNDVRVNYPSTWLTFASYVSGAMHQYVVGDYTKGAMLAIGIVDTGKSTTGNE